MTRIWCVVPPRSLDISLSPPVVKAGQSLTITCRSSTSNPASRLSWWKDGDEVVEGVDEGGTLPAEYGGWSTVSGLVMTPGVEDDGEIYACRATNTLLDEAVSDAVTLNVLCTTDSLLHQAVVTTAIQLRFDCDSTALPPFDDLCHDLAAELRHK